MRSARSRAILQVAALTAACVPRVSAPPPADIAAPAEFPATHYRQAAALGKKVLDIDPDRSVAVIEVRRGGRLAHLGHDHVVASRDLRGYVLPEEERADLYIPLERLTVDEAALRAEAGLDTQPSQEAIDGTRSNMLEKVLDTTHYPFALVQVRRQGSAWNVALTLHGVTRMVEVPARVEYAGGTLVASGSMAIRQSDFGIVPFSVLGGALQVHDRLEMRFRLVAHGG
jgi:hypothetical protein